MVLIQMQAVRFLLSSTRSQNTPSVSQLIAHRRHREKQQPRLLQYQEIGASPIGRFWAQWFSLKGTGFEPVDKFPPSMRGLSVRATADSELTTTVSSRMHQEAGIEDES
jgi:hypothetical protein